MTDTSKNDPDLSELDASTFMLLGNVGSIALGWNTIEEFQDQILANSVGLPASIKTDITSRIAGFDGRQAIIRAALASDPIYDNEACEVIRESLSGAAAVKVCRDNTIHARSADAAKGAAETLRSKGKLVHVDVSGDALSAIKDHLLEVMAEFAYIIGFTERLKQAARATSDPEKQRLEQEAQAFVAQVLAHQTKRRSLPPLPTYPPKP